MAQVPKPPFEVKAVEAKLGTNLRIIERSDSTKSG